MSLCFNFIVGHMESLFASFSSSELEEVQNILQRYALLKQSTDLLKALHKYECKEECKYKCKLDALDCLKW